MRESERPLFWEILDASVYPWWKFDRYSTPYSILMLVQKIRFFSLTWGDSSIPWWLFRLCLQAGQIFLSVHLSDPRAKCMQISKSFESLTWPIDFLATLISLITSFRLHQQVLRFQFREQGEEDLMSTTDGNFSFKFCCRFFSLHCSMNPQRFIALMLSFFVPTPIEFLCEGWGHFKRTNAVNCSRNVAHRIKNVLSSWFVRPVHHSNTRKNCSRLRNENAVSDFPFIF